MSANEPPLSEQGESIGSAHMADNGTITLMLRAEGPGVIGDAMLIYHPDDKDYSKILQHISGLKPGESKPVPPWSDTSES